MPIAAPLRSARHGEVPLIRWTTRNAHDLCSMKKLIFGFSLAAKVFGCFAGTESIPDDIHVRLLDVSGYAELNKAVIERDCNTKPQLAGKPICTNARSASSLYINELGRPFMVQHVSPSLAQQAYAFWSSPSGRSITKKMIAATAGGTIPNFSPDEAKRLDGFNRSPAGQAMMAFADDPSQFMALIRGINAMPIQPANR